MFVAVFLFAPFAAILPGNAQEANLLLRRSIDPAVTADPNAVQNDNPLATEFRGQAGFSTSIDDGSQPLDLTPQANNVTAATTTGSIAVGANSTTSSRLTSNTNTRAFKLLPQSQVGTLDANGQLNTRSNTAATTVEGGGAANQANPYAATGIRFGTFDLFPTLEQSVGYTSNPDFAENGKASVFSETAAGLRLQSNWARHRLQAELGATYQRFFSGDSPNLPTANANGSLRLDIGTNYAFTARGAYNLSTEAANSANLTTGTTASIVDRPKVHQFSSSAEIAKVEGRLRFSLRGSQDKTQYEDASLSDGATLQQGDRDNLLRAVTGRVSYQISPAISPFLEASIGKRTFELRTDRNGNQRDSNLYSLRGGLELNFGEKLTGQVSIGHTAESFKDPKINTLEALSIDGTLVWSPVRLTTITATASTSLAPSANINDNGSVIYSNSLGISRLVRPNLTLDANLTALLQKYDTSGRRDVSLGANAGYTYWFNRFVATTGRVSYQNVDSNDAGSSYDVKAIRFGLRFQR